MAKERQRLDLDLESLFPGDTFKIGDNEIVIHPLGVFQLATIAKQLKGFAKSITDDGVTWDNYNEPDNLIKIASVLLQQFPDILEEASNVHKEDIAQLPIEVVVELLDKIFEVNIKSKEKLSKNFKSLVEKFNTMTNDQAKPKITKKQK